MAPKCQGPYRCPGCPTCIGGAQSKHPDGEPRPLHPYEGRRIQRALRDHPPVYGPRPLRLVQTDPEQTTYTAPAICTNEMTCDCERCWQQRAIIINAGPKKITQPWDTRRAA